MSDNSTVWQGVLSGTFGGYSPFSVALNLPSSLEVGHPQTVEATVTDSSGNLVPDATAEWQSSDPTIATVVANGENTLMALITTLQEGTVTISAKVTVPVIAPAPTLKSVTLAVTDTNLDVNGTALIAATVLDSNDVAVLDAQVVWESSDPSVLVVAPSATSQAADVVALKEGTATVVAKVGELSASVDISVISAPVVVDPVPPVSDAVYAPRVWNSAKSPHSPHLATQITDFRTSYIEKLRILANRLWLASHCDVIMSAGHIQAYTDVGLKHIPYTLLFAPFSTDRPGDLLGSSGPFYEQWCSDNGRDPEDGYVHLAADKPRYAWPIASIDTEGTVTLKYGCRWAFEDGDRVTISSGSINGTYPVSKVTWQADGEVGSLTFVIPVVGQPSTGGTARNGVASGKKTAKDRVFIDINGFPPPRYLINPLSEVRRDCEIARTEQILATVYSGFPDYKVPGIFVDEVMPNWAIIQNTLEFGDATSNFNAALAGLLADIYASMKAPQNFLQPNIGSYLNENGMLISDAAKSVQCESTLNPFQRGIHSSWTWWEQAMAKGISPVAVGAFSWWDTAPSKWGGGLYSNDTKVLGAASIGMQREKIAEYCAYLMVAQPTDQEPKIYFDAWRGSKYDIAGDWENCWLPLYEADIGKPLGSRYSMGTFTNGKGLKVRVTARKFAHALVLCATPDDWNNPDYTDAGAVTIQLPTDMGALHLVHSDCLIDSEALTEITVRPAEGAILWIDTTGSGDQVDPLPSEGGEQPAPVPTDFSVWKTAYSALVKVDVAGPDPDAPVFRLTPTKEMVATHDMRWTLDPQPPSNTRQSFTFVVKADGCPFVAFQGLNQVEAAWVSSVDLTTGSVAHKAASHDITTESLSDGWFRIDWAFDTAKGSHPVSVSVRASKDDRLSPFAGNNKDGLLIQLARWETH